MSTGPLLAAHEVRWSPHGHDILRGVTLEITAGEVVALIGPTGAGKSTLLRVLGRLLRPSTGTVHFDGHDAWSLPPREVARRVAFLPQSPEASPEITVEELAWRGRYPHRQSIGGTFGKVFGGPTAADRVAVETALAQAGVAELRTARLGEISGGEQRRAWIALVLAQEPEVLLLDEPTTFLDISHQLELLQLLKQLHKKRSTTTVMALHDLSHAGYNATRVIALREGTIVASGPPSTVLTSEQLSELYGVPVTVLAGPTSASGGVTVPIIVPSAETPE